MDWYLEIENRLANPYQSLATDYYQLGPTAPNVYQQEKVKKTKKLFVFVHYKTFVIPVRFGVSFD
jgi:hypothetical protein